MMNLSAGQSVELPEFKVAAGHGFVAYLVVVKEPHGIEYLVRVIVDVTEGIETVVTVYRTSKFDKYWR